MKGKIDLGARLLLGLIFLVFGANGLMMVVTGAGFIPMPPPKPETMKVMGGLMGVVYLMPLVKFLQVVSGIMLLSGKYVNLALILLAPIVVNILGVHLFVDLEGLPMAIFISILLIVLIRNRWNVFKPLVAV